MIKRVLSKLRKVTMSLFAVLCAGAVWAEEGDVTYVTTPMDDPSAGYIRTGLGKKGNEVAVVFTNHTKTATWTVPANLYNVEFLVVGGGGGGGADNNDDVRMAGSGGGGGGVVTGLVNFVEGSIVSATVGKGGEGGFVEKKPGTSSYNYWGAAKLAGASTFGVGSDVYVTANAGGRDLGASATSYTSGTNGGSGGSGAGGRQKKNGGSATKGSGDNNFVVFYEAFGNNGGKGSTKDWYGGSANSGGGGGGAHPDPSLGVGGDAGWTEEGGWFGGKGGEGLTSNITGFDVVYGSGGGGGNATGLGGVAGEGAGDGNTANISGKGANYGRGNDALQNQGGGGGGGGRGDGPGYQKRGGGNGGSGIVVFRYSVYEAEVVTAEGSTLYATFAEAFDAAQAGETVKLLNDVATDAAFVVTKKVTIDLNGKTIATTQADTEGCGVFWVKTGGELTLNGEGTINGVGGNIYNIAIWADGGKVTINGGTYTNVGAQDDGPDGAHFDLIYAKNGGSVEINGGTFKCETPNWTLNSHDTAKGTIVVKGGTFYQFNPANCTTEGANTNFCADGLTAVLNEETGYYEIVDAWTAPMPEKDGEADITEEYTPDVLAVLEAAVATSVGVKVNGVELKGNEAVKALNTAVASFDNALTFDGTAATLDIVIEVTEVNAEDPAASTVVVKRGETVLSVKTDITPTVKYFYPETKTWGSDKPESGAVLFKLVF